MLEFFNVIASKAVAIVVGIMVIFGVVEMPSGVEYDAERQTVIRNREVREMIESSDVVFKKKEDVKISDSDVVSQKAEDVIIVEEDKTQKIIIHKETVSEVASISLDELNKKTREAVVNILCTSKRGGSFKPTSGSGVIIDPKGIIIINAHMGQYFLLEDYLVEDFMTCTIRTGSPAISTYNAELIYIHSGWMKENAADILIQEPRGTGEDDFALLYITGVINKNNELPEKFTYIEPDFFFDYVEIRDSVLLVSYPAGFLGGISIQKDLWKVSAEAVVEQIYTFLDESAPAPTLDLLSVGGSLVAQAGSSGGAVVNQQNGKLIGVIVTSTSADTTGERDLKAITLSHVFRSFVADTNLNIVEFLENGSSAIFLNAFTEEMEPLKEMLFDLLNSR